MAQTVCGDLLEWNENFGLSRTLSILQEVPSVLGGEGILYTMLHNATPWLAPSLTA